MDEADNNRLAELLMQLAQENTLVLSEFDALMQKILFNVGRAYYKNEDDIKDAVHDLYIVLREKAKKFRENTNACAWVVRVYKNLILTQLREKKKESGYIRNQIQDLKTQSYRSLEEEINNKVFFNQIMERLTVYERELLMCTMNSLSIRDIAAIVGKPKTTVNNHLQKLKEKIRKM